MTINRKDVVKAIETYLLFDQKSDTRFHDPSPKNAEYHKRVKIDAEKIADLVMLKYEKNQQNLFIEFGEYVKNDALALRVDVAFNNWVKNKSKIKMQ